MRRRILPAAAIAVLLAGGVTACSATRGGDACEPQMQPGALSESVRLSGETADDLSAKMSDGLSVVNSQRSVIVPAEQSGPVATEGSIVSANFAYFEAATGELLQVDPSFGTDEGAALFVAKTGSSPVIAGMLCAIPGQTIALAMSPAESANMGVVGGPLVIVGEVLDVFGDRASGSLRALPSGFPAVTTDHTGRPGIVLPPQGAPSEVKTAVRIKGDGAKVTAENIVIGQALTVGWDGSVISNTWTSGPENLSSEANAEKDGKSYRAQLTGQTVGSQIIVIEPNDGNPRVSVIDILAVA